MTLKIIPVIMLIMLLCVAAFVITEQTRVNEPSGSMTAGVIHPAAVAMEEITYIPAYPGDECERKDRVLIGSPTETVDANGTVSWEWLYENRSNARNRHYVTNAKYIITET